MKVTTRLQANGRWICRTTSDILTDFVVSNETSEYAAQYKAARFLDYNFPGEPIEWEDGYHVGDTSSKIGDLVGHYHD